MSPKCKYGILQKNTAIFFSPVRSVPRGVYAADLLLHVTSPASQATASATRRAEAEEQVVAPDTDAHFLRQVPST